MLLPGNLNETTLGDLLGDLYRARVSGVLELISQDAPFQGASHRISLSNGLVATVHTPLPGIKIGELLYEQHALSAHAYQCFLRDVYRYPGVRAGDLLMDKAQVRPELLMDGLTLQTQQRMRTLLRLRHATIRFHPGRARSDVRVESRVLTPEQFLQGAPRARDHRKASKPPHSSTKQNLREAQDPWAILGLRPGASIQQIRKAFRRLALSMHPDLHVAQQQDTRDSLSKRFSKVIMAYQTLVARQALS